MFFARTAVTFPPELAHALQSVLWPQEDPALLTRRGRALRALWEKLAKGRGQARAGETHYSFRREEADAYAAYYLPANCLKPALVLEESFLLGEDPIPGNTARWLDFGTGPGTAYWGLAWWCAKRKKQLEFTGWDQSTAFTDLARGLTSRSPFGFRPSFLAREGDPLSLTRKLKPTHLSFMNSLAEIYPEPERRRDELAKLFRILRDLEQGDGHKRFLLLLDPGSRESSRELAWVKDQLQDAQIGFVSLPCLDARPCGALVEPKDWCHEEVACEFPDWLNELGAEAGMRKEALLFSYAFLQTAPSTRPAKARYRIVSQRLERKGQVECRLCTTEGKKPVRVQRSKADAQSELLFEAARGDLWIDAEIGEKGDLRNATRVEPAPGQRLF